METFYQYLSVTHKDGDLYLENLAAIMQATRDQMQALASELAWQSWGEQKVGS